MTGKSEKTMLNVLTGLALVGSALSVAKFVPIPTALGDVLTPIGVFIFVATLVISIRYMFDRLKNLDVVREDLHQLAAIAAYGDAMSRVVSAYGNVNEDAHYVRASSKILQNHVKTYLTQFADGVGTLRDGRSVFPLTETYMISSMLGAILDMLPAGAVWLGVTRLTAAWNISDPDFRAFSDQMHGRSQKGDLTVLRLYRLSDKPDDGLRAAVQEHKEKNVIQRFTYAEVDDISILWGPPGKGIKLGDQLRSADSLPTVELRRLGLQPICAMRFEARNGIWLHQVRVIPPTLPEFQRACNDFDGNWRTAQAEC
jgi:hypothetical protein